MSSTVEELKEQIAQCDREIFALEERKRELRRTIRIVRLAEHEKAIVEKAARAKEEGLKKRQEKIREKLLQ